ncbi:MAG: arginine--tRNA ligase, partial [Candidatus Atribacteria bacterium]|nr:arginine--tRNA ligase [Candidatus Atribacteria bacterium]
MSRLITEVIKNVLQKVLENRYPEATDGMMIAVEPTREKSYGDFASNIAFLLSKKFRKLPRDIAIDLLPDVRASLADIASVEVAGGGFINFFLDDRLVMSFLQDIFQEKEEYGAVDVGKGDKFQVEFVSVNPTGPLHVGHGKCAAFGDALARVLKKAGFAVEKEYYINDTGRQIDNLGLTLEARYCELLGQPWEIPEGGYKG